MIPHSRPWLTVAEHDAAAEVVDSGHLAAGPRTEEFAARLRQRTGVSALATTASGSAALCLALRALSLPDGAEVVLPTYVCASALSAVRRAGLVPALCDVGPDWNMTPATVERAIGPRTGAIVLVSIFGIEADAARFRAFGVPIVHDLCQCLAGGMPDPAVEDRGDLLVFSFHATKMLCAGHGGAVAVARSDAAPGFHAAAAEESVFGALTDLQAAVGLVQLNRWEEIVTRRTALAASYCADFTPGATSPAEQAFGSAPRATVPFRFPLRQARAPFAQVADAFAERGVIVRRGVDTLLHRGSDLDDERFPNASRLFDETVSVPFYPALTTAEERVVIDAQRTVWEQLDLGD